MGLRPDLRVEITRVGHASVISPHGEIDIATAPQVEAALDAARGAQALLLDLRGVEFIDTSGLRLIFHQREQSAAEGYRFAVIRGPTRVQRLLEIAGFPYEDSLFVDAPAETTDGGGK